MERRLQGALYSITSMPNEPLTPAKRLLYSFSQSPDASASLTFSGDAVAVYGTMSVDHSDILVTLDGRQKTFTGGAGGFVSGLRPQVRCFFLAPPIVSLKLRAQVLLVSFVIELGKSLISKPL